jgi:UPF0716 protein FxsA
MGPILFVLFIVVPLLELAVIIQVGQLVGTGPTVLLLLAVSLVGAALVKREGLRAWFRFRQAVAEGRVPAKEVVDGALLLFGGALLLTPGFLTDAVGLLLLVPVTREVVRRVLRRRVTVFGLPPQRGRTGGSDAQRGGRDRQPREPGPDPHGGVIDVEVVDVRRDDTRGDRGGA